MDTYTERHLTTWLDSTVLSDERDTVENQIRCFVAEHPDVIERNGWPEIRTMAERWAA